MMGNVWNIRKLIVPSLACLLPFCLNAQEGTVTADGRQDRQAGGTTPVAAEILHKKVNLGSMAIEVGTDAAPKQLKRNCLMDFSALMAKDTNLTPAGISVVEDVLQISYPANGCYRLKLRFPALLKPGCSYQWSFACSAKSMLETHKCITRVSCRIGDDTDGTQGNSLGISATKDIILAGGDYKTYTFSIPIPDGAAAGERVFDLEYSNPDSHVVGGTIKICRMELKQEVRSNEQAQETYELWPAGLPPGHKEIPPDKEYMAGNWYRDVSRPTLRVFKPTGKSRQQVGVILFPGGSFSLLDSMAPWATWLNSLGITAFELKYRVPSNPRSIALQDAQRALRLVRSKATELGIAKLGIMGSSAGTHLALMTATNFDRPSYGAIDAVDKLECRPDFVIALCAPYTFSKDGIRSDEIRIDDKTPSIFFAHGDADPYPAINSAALYIELRKRNIPSELHVWSKAGHSVELQKRRQWTELCAEWLKTMGIINP